MRRKTYGDKKFVCDVSNHGWVVFSDEGFKNNVNFYVGEE